MRQEVIITIWPKRDDNNRVLIIAIDVDPQTAEQPGGAFFFDPSINHEVLDLYSSCSWTVAVI
jgi:hypothetical protein